MKTLLLVVACLTLSGAGKTFHTKEEALVVAYGKAEIARTPHYWSKAQRKEVASLAGVKKVSGTHAEYQPKSKSGKIIAGRSVWFDTRIVRSKPQTIMMIVDAKQRIEKIVVCNFSEPLDYKPVDRWYAQFEGKVLDGDLKLKKGIHGVSGATLTSRATTAAVREMLAAHAVAHPIPKKQKEKNPK